MNFEQNYFEIFGLPVSFDVDQALLDDRFLGLQKEVHPDRFAASTDQEKRLAMQWATLVNTANETLRSPLSRAIYLLRLQEVELDHNPTLPPDFLMEQIELREQLDTIEQNADDLDGLDEFRRQLKGVMVRVEAEFAQAMPTDLKQAEALVYEMQFLNKLSSSAKRVEEKLLEY